MSIRLKILAGCIGMLLVTIGLGLYERLHARALGDLAVRVYDESLMSISYVRNANLGFVRFAMTSQDPKGLNVVLSDLDVAIERASSPETRTATKALQEKVTALRAARQTANTDQGTVARAIETDFDNLVELVTADGFTQRSNVDSLIAASEHSIRYALGASVAVALAITLALGAAIVRPVRRGVAVAVAIADGKLDNIIDIRGRSETAALLRALAGMQDAIADNLARIEAQRIADQEQQAQFQTTLTSTLRGMADTVETETTAAVDIVDEHTQAMAANADAMERSAVSTETATRAAMVAAEQALGTTQMVASAADQLTASIREISAQVNQSTLVVGQAVAAASESKEAIESLSERVERIGAVAGIIAKIASQTNLLALNATIEAARAGIAGKGFAVVASEVKQLAVQTAQSTDEITRHIRDVRSATDGSFNAVGRIVSTIEDVNAIAGSIAAAVEQQAAATAEIARNVTETANAVNQMTTRIAEVTREAERTGRSAMDVRDSAAGLTASVADLKRTVVRAVRTSTPQVDRRGSERHIANFPCHVQLDGLGSIGTRTVNLSDGGARVLCHLQVPLDTHGTLRLSGVLEPLPFVVRRIHADGLGIHLILSEDMRTIWHSFVRPLQGRAA